MNDNKESLGFRIKHVREIGNVNQEKLGQLIGRSKNTVWSWEADKTMPNADDIARISEKLGCNPNWLLTGSGDPYTVMVAAGSIEDKVKVEVEDEVEERDLPLDYWKDRGWLERWIAEEDAIRLYRITREELTHLEKIPILGFEEREDDYAGIYRACLLMHRRKGKPQRHEDTKVEVQKKIVNE